MTRLLPLLLLSALSAPLLAEPPAQASRAVATADLDLSSAKDIRKLEHRLSIAIVEACGDASAVDVAGRNQVRACQVEARARVGFERDRILAARSASAGTLVAAR